MSVSWLLLKKSDRQSRGRLVLTAAAIALGVLLVLSYAAGLNAMVTSNGRPIWTIAANGPIDGVAPTYMNMTTAGLYQWGDEDIEVVSLRTTGDNSPQLPGLEIPQPGTYYASTRLAELIENNPVLAERFDGTMIGRVPDSLITSPDTLMVIRGMSEADQTTLGERVSAVYKFYLPTDEDYRMEVGILQKTLLIIGSITLLFPIVLLISVATQLGSKQRERRYAALRLVGATRQQINRSTVLESLLVAVSGIAVGTVTYLLIRPLYANFRLSGVRFFLDDIAISGTMYAAIVGITLLLVLLANWWGLRKVKSSPLGVVRQQRLQKSPRWWGLVPLILGMGLLIYIGQLSLDFVQSSDSSANQFLFMVMAALLFLIIGLITAGPWLTTKLARLVARFTKKPVTLLATKRIALLSRQTYRAVSGVVIALFIGSFYLAFVGGVEVKKEDQAVQNGYSQLQPSTILVAGDLPADFDRTLQQISGVESVAPFYDADNQSTFAAIACEDLPTYTKHNCPDGGSDQYALIDFSGSVVDTIKPDKVVTFDQSFQPAGYLVQGATALEPIRTAVARTTTPSATVNAWVISGESSQKTYINPVISELGQLAYIVIGLTLFVAVASLTISTISGLLERQRSFYTLRLSGMTVSQLRRVMVIESLIPLLLVSVIASVLGYWASSVFLRLGSTAVSALLPPSYYIIVAVALVSAAIAIAFISRQIGALTTTEQNQTE